MQTITAKNGTQYLWAPLSRDEIVEMIETDGMVKANIGVSLDDLLDTVFDELYEIASEKITGNAYVLEKDETDYKVVDVDENNVIVIEVSSWISEENYDYLSD